MSQLLWTRKRKEDAALGDPFFQKTVSLPSQKSGDSFSQNVELLESVNDITRTYEACHDCDEGAIVWDESHPPWECGGVGGTKWLCQNPDAGLDCRKFADVPAASAKANSPYVAGKDETIDKHIKCTYNMKLLATSQPALRQWMQERGQIVAPDGWDDSLMHDYCMTNDENPAINCPGNPKGPCPNLMTKSLCTEWANSTHYPAADATMGDWCRANTGSPVCACIERSLDPDFAKIQPLLMQKFNEGCWYLPCRDTEMYSRLSIYNMRHPKDCPTDVCEQIVNIVDSAGADISNLKMEMDCSGGGGGGGGGNATQKVIAASVGVGVSVLGIGMIAYALLSKKK
jgi:hypothetical protein